MAHIWEVILKGACAGQAAYNVLHFQDNADEGIAALETLLTAGGTSTIDIIMAVLCLDYSISSLLCRTVDPAPPGAQVEVPLTGAPYTGTYNSTASALPSSGLIKWTTPLGGRSKRGRSYFGPLGSASNDDGLLGTTAFNALSAIATHMKNVYMSNGQDYNGNWEFGVWSRALSEFEPFTGATPRQQIRTQRRRQLGVGI